MLNFREYNKNLDMDLEEWSKENYSKYYSDIKKYALFDESIFQLYKWYKANPDQMESIYDKFIVIEENNLKIGIIVINYFISEKDNQKVFGINPIIVNPKYINKGFGRKILKHIISHKGEICGMTPDRIYAGIDYSNLRCKHLFESLGFIVVGKTDDNKFMYYELELY